MTGASTACNSPKRVKHDCICWVMGTVSMHDEADPCKAEAANAMGAAIAIVL